MVPTENPPVGRIERGLFSWVGGWELVLNYLNERKEKNNALEQQDSPGDLVVKNPPADAGDTGSIPGP